MVGPPYWVVARLCYIAERHWAAIDGEAASHGTDYFDLSVDRFLNAIWWWAVQRVKDSAAWESEMLRAPRGMQVTAEDLDADAETFLAFASAFGVRPPVPGDAAPPALESAVDATEG